MTSAVLRTRREVLRRDPQGRPEAVDEKTWSEEAVPVSVATEAIRTAIEKAFEGAVVRITSIRLPPPVPGELAADYVARLNDEAIEMTSVIEVPTGVRDKEGTNE